MEFADDCTRLPITTKQTIATSQMNLDLKTEERPLDGLDTAKLPGRPPSSLAAVALLSPEFGCERAASISLLLSTALAWGDSLIPGVRLILSARKLRSEEIFNAESYGEEGAGGGISCGQFLKIWSGLRSTRALNTTTTKH